MMRRPPRSTLSSSSAASDVYKRQVRMDSVRDGGDRNLRERRLRKHAPPQAARHVCVQLRDAVDARRKAQPENRHRKELVRVLGNLPAETEELVEGNPVGLDLRGEVLLHQLVGKQVNPRRHGRICLLYTSP